jgi:RNA polymerase sigma-70 factor (ECF subfamily)
MEKAVPRAGEAEAACDIASLVREHHAVVYRYAFRLTGAVPEAEDLVQQAFLLAHQRLDQLREPARAAGWLMAIVRNCFLKGRRRLRLEEPLLGEVPAETEQEFPDWVDPEHLQLALKQLPDEARAILVLYFFEDCSYKEIAESLELPLGTVMSRLSRAKEKLRHLLTAPTPRELTARK